MLVVRQVAIVFSLALISGCSRQDYEVAYTTVSPDGKFSAQMEWKDEGTLGSTRYRVSLVEKSDGKSREVFRGTRGWVSAPVWLDASTLIIPFCFGKIASVESVLPIQGGTTVKFRSSESSLIRIHVVTAPQTVIGTQHYCSP